MRVSAMEMNDISTRSGFDAAIVEKVLRLKEILRELDIHADLAGKFVLKGGTAINVFLSEFPRLSVDIDLNYIGASGREEMLKDRSVVERAVGTVGKGLGYKVQLGKNEYALYQVHMSYRNHLGRDDKVTVDVNFIHRIPVLAPVTRTAFRFGDEEPCETQVLALEELFGGKTKALIERAHPRDVYDLYRFAQQGAEYDKDLMRKIAVLLGSTIPKDFREYGMDSIEGIAPEDVDRQLYPLIRADDRPTLSEMLDVVRPIVEPILDHSLEAEYLAEIAAGNYCPELLFREHQKIAERIKEYPALLWKAQNVRDYLGGEAPPVSS